MPPTVWDVGRKIPTLSLQPRERQGWGNLKSSYRGKGGPAPEKQRRSAVPKLLDYSDEAALDPETRKWVFQALGDITGQSLPHEAAAWRNWYSTSDGKWKPATRDRE